jgi:hypothetical protein
MVIHPIKIKQMKKIILISLLAVSIHSQAQVYVDRIGFKLESIADIDIGWMKIYNRPIAAKGKTLGNRIYSDKQIGYCHLFVEWMQQSYLPKGCLGDAGVYQNYIPKFSSTNSRIGNARNQHKAALPHLYGAFAQMYMFLKKDAQGNFAPQNSFAEFWRIEANQLEHISKPVSFISSAEEYYFVLPDFTSHPKGYDADDKVASNLLGFANHKNIEGYKHFYIPGKMIDDNPYYVVIMTKNNEPFPFEKITIGEFFTEAEKQLPVWQKTEPVSPENFSRAQKNLVRLKDKYKNKWNDIAELKLSGTDITLYSFVNATEGYDDMFDNKDIYGKEGVSTTFPILKVSKQALALCKTDQPQWLVIRWTTGMPNQAFNLHLHESVMNNFNFKYAYDYFFNPEKVKGQPYKPLHSPAYKETVLINEGSELTKKNNVDKNVHFFEDFSTSTVGQKPIGWQSTLALGTTSVVTKLDGLDGNWAIMTNYKVNPTQLKTPLPQNFTLSYEIVAAQNFTWGAKGLTFQLSKEVSAGNAESYLQLKLRPGYDGRDGEVTLETKFPGPGYSNGTKWFVAPGFSNNKKNNHITVTIKKKDETLQVFIDKTKIVEYEKAMPAAHVFNAMSFTSVNSGENDKFYISNIKIIKD